MPFNEGLDWGEIGKGTVWEVIVVVVRCSSSMRRTADIESNTSLVSNSSLSLELNDSMRPFCWSVAHSQ